MNRGAVQASRPKLSQAFSLTPRSLFNNTTLLAATTNVSAKSALINPTCIVRVKAFHLTELASANY